MPENCLSSKTTLEQRLCEVLARVRAAELKFGRPAGSVQVLPVSKTRPVEEIAAVLELAVAGIGSAFGENYLQEALDKMKRLPGPDVQWHFIGPIQSNKTSAIAKSMDWVHSVDREKIARRLNEQRPAELPRLNVCLQINVSAESSKSGVTLEALPALAVQVAQMPNLRLRGMMAIPAASKDPAEQRAAFHAVSEAFTLLKDTHCVVESGVQGQGDWQHWDTLSMGMSADLEMAIAEGATIVRIGTDIFGPRT